MRRTISLLAAALVVGGLAAGPGGAIASTKHVKKHAAKGKTATLQCHISLTQQPGAGQDAALPAAVAGDHYGRIRCNHGFGWGVIHDSFTVPDSGDTVAKYVAYFNGGTLAGSFDLTPGEGDELSGTSFGSVSSSGPVTVDGGSGTYNGITAGKKKGVLSCKSPDGVRLTCKGTMSVVLPAA